MSGEPNDASARRDTPLALKLKARIARDGPIPVAEFMHVCLQDAEHGYYVKQPVIGATGDFITAPEISQVFGELIGLWSAVVWVDVLSAPAHLGLVEYGPGRGTMMRDALRAARLVKGFSESVVVHLVENSETLTAAQRQTLSAITAPLSWGCDLDGVATPAIVVANEFLDALPITQWIKTGDGWQQRGVGLDDNSELCFVAKDSFPPSPSSPCDERGEGWGEGQPQVKPGSDPEHPTGVILGLVPRTHQAASSNREEQADAGNATVPERADGKGELLPGPDPEHPTGVILGLGPRTHQAPSSNRGEQADAGKATVPAVAATSGTMGPRDKPEDDNFIGLSKNLDRQFPGAGVGDITEILRPDSVVAALKALSTTGPVAALFIDYGHDVSSLGETLQAVRNHTYESPLTSPGEADLSSHVDFAAFARACHAAGFKTDGPIAQAEFLGRLGIIERASKLMSANPAKAGEIESAIARLLAPGGMGGRFKVIGVRSAGLPKLPGF